MQAIKYITKAGKPGGGRVLQGVALVYSSALYLGISVSSCTRSIAFFLPASFNFIREMLIFVWAFL